MKTRWTLKYFKYRISKLFDVVIRCHHEDCFYRTITWFGHLFKAIWPTVFSSLDKVQSRHFNLDFYFISCLGDSLRMATFFKPFFTPSPQCKMTSLLFYILTIVSQTDRILADPLPPRLHFSQLWPLTRLQVMNIEHLVPEVKESSASLNYPLTFDIFMDAEVAR